MKMPPIKNDSIKLGAGIVFGAALGFASEAAAFTRTLGCSADGEVCSELFWPTNCATYLLEGTTAQAAGQPVGLSLAQIEAEVDASFAVWDDSAVDCSYLTLTDGGVVNGLGTGFDNDGEEDNVIVFVTDGWLDLGSGHDAAAIALTSVFFDPETGVIVNADMEFNAEFFRPMIIGQTISDPLDPRTEADLRNTITHEAGHFLGLDHTNISDATMFAVAQTGEINKRDLAQDDLDGVCAIYPADEDPGKCKPAGFLPRNRLFDCAVDQGAAPEDHGALLWSAALFGLSLVALSSRRRKSA
jgi:Matrixin